MNSTENGIYKLRERQWAKNALLLMPIYTWQTGKLQLWRNALKNQHNTSDFWMIYGGIWDHSEEDFKELIQTLNNHHKSQKVKYELKDSSINFLDTTTYKGPGFPDQRTLDIKVFFKPTDTHALLHKKVIIPVILLEVLCNLNFWDLREFAPNKQRKKKRPKPYLES